MSTPTAMDRFIEHLGLSMQAEGMPRIAGQILGYLMVEGEARTLAQMCTALGISKASASTNARLLEFKGAIRRTRPVGSRQDAYVVFEEPNIRMMELMASRFRASGEEIAALSAEFPPSHAAARARVAQMAEIYQRSASFIEHWSRELATETAAAGDSTKGAEP